MRNLREQPDDCSGTLQSKANGGHSLNYQNPVAIEAVGRKMSGGPEVGDGVREDGTMFTLDTDSKHAVAWTERTRDGVPNLEMQEDLAYPLRNPGEGGGGSSMANVAIPLNLRHTSDDDVRRGAGTPGTGVGKDGDPANTLSVDGAVQAVATPIVMAPSFSKRPGQQIATREDGTSFALTSGEPPSITTEAVPISSDALRGEGVAQTESADAEGRERLRDPGLGIGDEGDPSYTVNATSPPAVGVEPQVVSRDGVPKTADNLVTDLRAGNPHPSAVAVRTSQTGANGEGVSNEVAHTLDSAPEAVAFTENQRGEVYCSGDTGAVQGGGGKPGQGYQAIAFNATQDPISEDETALPLESSNGRYSSGVSTGMLVRRLTPLECERLQGFPDGWTDGQPDSTRYRQLGNAVAVPVVEWIARRIKASDVRRSATAYQEEK